MRQQFETAWALAASKTMFPPKIMYFPPQTSYPTLAANISGNTAGFALGIPTWYYALFPQMEQQPIFNSVNFSLSPMDFSQVSAASGKGKLAALCPVGIRQ